MIQDVKQHGKARTAAAISAGATRASPAARQNGLPRACLTGQGFADTLGAPLTVIELWPMILPAIAGKPRMFVAVRDGADGREGPGAPTGPTRHMGMKIRA